MNETLSLQTMEVTDIPFTSVTAITTILLTIIYYFIKTRGVLPGPKGVPYLGLYPFLNDENYHLKLHEYKKKYGDIYSFTYTGKLFINLGSVHAMREFYMNKSDWFVDRFTDFHVLSTTIGQEATMANGEAWKVRRKFYHERLKKYGLFNIRDDLAGPVYDSMNAITDDFKALRGKPIKAMDMLADRCSVLMRKVIFGEEGVSSEEFRNMNLIFGESQNGMFHVNLLLIGPFARLLFSILPKFRRAMRLHRSLEKLVHTCVKRIEDSMELGQPTCVVEDFYNERAERRRNDDPTWKYFTDEMLVHSVLQFVGDGVRTFAMFVVIFLDTLAHYPEEQDKLYAELMQVVGPHRHIVLEDKSRLPAVNAFIHEALRYSTPLRIFPNMVFTKETAVRGYRIPKGSVALLNIYSANHDSETFEDPDIFNPARYLPPSGKSKKTSPLIFGMGKRSCTGEPYIMIQFFLIFASIVKNFKITSSNKNTGYVFNPNPELTFHPRVENEFHENK